MSATWSERRLAENEVFFRQMNEQMHLSMQKGFDKLNKVARETGDPHVYGVDDDMPFSFYCECSNENCHARVPITPKVYHTIHKDKKAFVVVPGHEVERIERVIAKKSGYNVVQKHEEPPASASNLNQTHIKNSSK